METPGTTEGEGWQLCCRLNDTLKDWFVETHLKRATHYVVVGEVAARQHYHLVFNFPVGPDSIKKYCGKKCKELNYITKAGQENAHYGAVKEVKTIPGALSYALKDRLHTPLHEAQTGIRYDLSGMLYMGWTAEYLQTVPRFQSVEDLVYAQDLSGVFHVVKEKKPNMREKFVRHLQEEKGWEYYERNPAPEEVLKQCFNFYEAAFSNNQAVVICRHARFKFSDELHRATLLNNISYKILSDI